MKPAEAVEAMELGFAVAKGQYTGGSIDGGAKINDKTGKRENWVRKRHRVSVGSKLVVITEYVDDPDRVVKLMAVAETRETKATPAMLKAQREMLGFKLGDPVYVLLESMVPDYKNGLLNGSGQIHTQTA